MRLHLQRELEKLKQQILALSAEVEDDVRGAVRAMDERNHDMALDVINREDQTNTMEVDVEEECLKILALHQPVAADLRYIIAVLKINQDLERIGDLAVHIAECSLCLCRLPELRMPFRLGDMADRAQSMLKNVLDAFIKLDARAAHQVCADDNEIDRMRSEIFDQVCRAIRREPEQLESLLQVMHIARHLERIADHATNIAEDLIYLTDGRIVRHTPEVSDRL
ncbi:MAG: phosphate signaling complex protein PhoU [Kiritimatiellia bacterium]